MESTRLNSKINHTTNRMTDGSTKNLLNCVTQLTSPPSSSLSTENLKTCPIHINREFVTWLDSIVSYLYSTNLSSLSLLHLLLFSLTLFHKVPCETIDCFLTSEENRGCLLCTSKSISKIQMSFIFQMPCLLLLYHFQFKFYEKLLKSPVVWIYI